MLLLWGAGIQYTIDCNGLWVYILKEMAVGFRNIVYTLRQSLGIHYLIDDNWEFGT